MKFLGRDRLAENADMASISSENSQTTSQCIPIRKAELMFELSFTFPLLTIVLPSLSHSPISRTTPNPVRLNRDNRDVIVLRDTFTELIDCVEHTINKDSRGLRNLLSNDVLKALWRKFFPA